jgi:tetratricopeptide (TPR) repeat protein
LRRALPILASAILAGWATLACGGSSDPHALTDSGAAALNSGNPKQALSDFDQALEHMDPANPDFLRAKIGRCQALARTDAARAQTEFLALAKDPAAKVGEQDYATVALDLVKSNAIGPAVAIAEAGIRRYPESPTMKNLRDKVGDAAKKANDPDAMKKLKGLGYAGDG